MHYPGDLLSTGSALADDNILRDCLHLRPAGKHLRHPGDHSEQGPPLRHELLPPLPRPGGHPHHRPRYVLRCCVWPGDFQRIIVPNHLIELAWGQGVLMGFTETFLASLTKSCRKYCPESS